MTSQPTEPADGRFFITAVASGTLVALMQEHELDPTRAMLVRRPQDMRGYGAGVLYVGQVYTPDTCALIDDALERGIEVRYL